MKKRALISAITSLFLLSGCGTTTVQPTTTATPTPTTTTTVKTTNPTPTPTTTSTSTTKTYSLSEVATHNQSSDCWTTINGNVYNLTPFFGGKHPGGDDKLQMLCGKDGTTLFNGKHGQSDKAKAMLATLIIGTLK